MGAEGFQCSTVKKGLLDLENDIVNVQFLVCPLKLPAFI